MGTGGAGGAGGGAGTGGGGRGRRILDGVPAGAVVLLEIVPSPQQLGL